MDTQNTMKSSDGELLAEKVMGELASYSHVDQVLFFRSIQSRLIEHRKERAQSQGEYAKQQACILQEIQQGTDLIAAGLPQQ
jgi:hypothetical protein